MSQPKVSIVKILKFCPMQMCSMQLVIGFQTYVVGYTELWIM